MDGETLGAALAITGKAIGEIEEEVKNVTLAYTYKGSVAAVADLPSSAETGDLYTVSGEQYVYDGTAWVKIISNVKAIPAETINEMLEEE